MKKISLLIASLIICSCSINEQIFSYKYNREEKYQNIWEDDVIYNETILFVEDENGVLNTSTLYDINKVISIRDKSLNKEMDLSNFKIDKNKIVSSNKKDIPYITYLEDKCLDPDLEQKGLLVRQTKDAKAITNSTGEYFADKYLFITYSHKDKWNGNKIESKGQHLNKIVTKLKNKNAITTMTLGDSIYYGFGASSLIRSGGFEPNQETFHDGFNESLRLKYEVQVNDYNLSVGGKLSEWGVSLMPNRLEDLDISPDLAIIGFGMNDGTLNVPASQYITNINKIIEGIREYSPDCSIIICATILPNNVLYPNSLQEKYLEYLEGFNDFDNTALLDMTSFTKYIYSRKNTYSCLLNNFNHPSDFVVRSYVSLLMNLLEEN